MTVQRKINASKKLPNKQALSPTNDRVDRLKGTLPEQISQNELSDLNVALQFLFNDLRQAKSLLISANKKDRKSYILALHAAWRFIILFRPAYREGLIQPLVQLDAALLALDDNNTTPFLEPTSRRGRSVCTPAYSALQGFAAATVHRLRNTELDEKKARRLVADELQKLNVQPTRGSGKITTRTVKGWIERISADVTKTGLAATEYQLVIGKDAKAPIKATPTDVRRYALTALRTFVIGNGLGSPKKKSHLPPSFSRT